VSTARRRAADGRCLGNVRLRTTGRPPMGSRRSRWWAMTGGCSRAFRWHRDQTSPGAGRDHADPARRGPAPATRPSVDHGGGAARLGNVTAAPGPLQVAAIVVAAQSRPIGPTPSDPCSRAGPWHWRSATTGWSIPTDESRPSPLAEATHLQAASVVVVNWSTRRGRWRTTDQPAFSVTASRGPGRRRALLPGQLVAAAAAIPPDLSIHQPRMNRAGQASARRRTSRPLRTVAVAAGQLLNGGTVRPTGLTDRAQRGRATCDRGRRRGGDGSPAARIAVRRCGQLVGEGRRHRRR